MLKMALLDCVVNEKCCSVDRGRGICPLFSSSPRGIWQLKPHPREFATQGKKNANARESARGVGGGGTGWELTDAEESRYYYVEERSAKQSNDWEVHF